MRHRHTKQNGREAIEMFRRHRPDVTLMDLRLPGMSGIDALIAIRAEFPEARVVMLTTFEGDAEIQRALKAGARGYLLKSTPPKELVETLRHVHAGRKGIPQQGLPGAYDCIKAFSETDLTEDLKRFDVPTLILHGDDDQIVPIADSALLSSKIVKGATLKVYPGLPHGMCSTHKDQINEDLLAFVKGEKSASA